MSIQVKQTYHQRLARIREPPEVLLHRARQRAAVYRLCGRLVGLDRHAHVAWVGQAATRSDVSMPSRLRHVVFVLVHVDARVLECRVGELGVKVGNTLIRVDNGLERRRDLLLVEQVPVNRLEERVLLELGRTALGAKTVLRVAVEQTLDKLLAVVANDCEGVSTASRGTGN